jgi:hypothetical protein
MLRTGYVVNSSKAISAILKKQSIRCSNRPHLAMASDFVGVNKAILFTDCNDLFRRYRKLFYDLFGSRNNTAAFNSIEEDTRQCLRIVLRKHEDLVSRLRS